MVDLMSGMGTTGTFLFGFVRVDPPGTGPVGTHTGTLTLTGGNVIFLQQPVGPGGGPVSLQQVNNQFAVLGGTLSRAVDGRTFLNVTLVIPRPFVPGSGQSPRRG